MPKFLNEKVACGTTCIQLPEDKLVFSKGCKQSFRKDKALKFQKVAYSDVCCDIIQESSSIPTAGTQPNTLYFEHGGNEIVHRSSINLSSTPWPKTQMFAATAFDVQDMKVDQEAGLIFLARKESSIAATVRSYDFDGNQQVLIWTEPTQVFALGIDIDRTNQHVYILRGQGASTREIYKYSYSGTLLNTWSITDPANFAARIGISEDASYCIYTTVNSSGVAQAYKMPFSTGVSSLFLAFTGVNSNVRNETPRIDSTEGFCFFYQLAASAKAIYKVNLDTPVLLTAATVPGTTGAGFAIDRTRRLFFTGHTNSHVYMTDYDDTIQTIVTPNGLDSISTIDLGY